MSAVHLKFSALRQGRLWEYILRFALGGLATLATGLIADLWGPVIAGLFLGFPALFAASATLVDRHERQKKQQKGLSGEARGRNAAALEARGAFYGSAAMAGFALAIWWFLERGAAIAFTLAGTIWLVTAYSIWAIARRHGAKSLINDKVNK